MARTIEVKEHTFDIETWYQAWVDNTELGAFAKDRVRFDQRDSIDYLGKLNTLSIQILEHKLVEDSYPVTFSYKAPKTAWQHLKLERAPKWFTDKYPVEYAHKSLKRTVKITRKATYPMADIVVPKNMGKVVIKDVVSPLSFSEDD